MKFASKDLFENKEIQLVTQGGANKGKAAEGDGQLFVFRTLKMNMKGAPKKLVTDHALTIVKIFHLRAKLTAFKLFQEARAIMSTVFHDLMG